MFLEILAMALSVNFATRWTQDTSFVYSNSGVSSVQQTIVNNDTYVSTGLVANNLPNKVVVSFYDREISRITTDLLVVDSFSYSNSALTFSVSTLNTSKLNLMFYPCVVYQNYGSQDYLTIYDNTQPYQPCCVDGTYQYTFSNSFSTGSCKLAFKFVGIDENTYNRLISDSDTVYTQGYQNGYNDGYNNGTQDGYQNGYNEGTVDGAETGYDSGYNQGYSAGVNDANQYSFGNLFGAVADTPVLMVRNLFNFDFFGVNVLTVVLSLFTALILFYILRKLL